MRDTCYIITYGNMILSEEGKLMGQKLDFQILIDLNKSFFQIKSIAISLLSSDKITHVIICEY